MSDKSKSCNVSFNARLTFPRNVNTSGDPSQGIRFECSWNSAPNLSPSIKRRETETRPENQFQGRTQFSSATTQVEALRTGRIYVRKNSSSGYCSSEASPYLAATLTLTSCSSGPPVGPEESLRRSPQPYDRRCRSTCSIVLQNDQCDDKKEKTNQATNFPLKPRRVSEGEAAAWNSHGAVPRLVPQSGDQSRLRTECPQVSSIASFLEAKVIGK